MDQVEFVSGDLLDQLSMVEALRSFGPDEVYNLAAQSHVHVSFDMPVYTAEVKAAISMLGPGRMLALRKKAMEHRRQMDNLHILINYVDDIDKEMAYIRDKEIDYALRM